MCNLLRRSLDFTSVFYVHYLYFRFGANDASVGQNCSVPEDEYQDNLTAIVEHLKYFFHHIIVMSPTPVDGDRRLKYQRERYGEGATGILERTTERSRLYRDISEDVAKKSGVMFMDLFSDMLATGKNIWETYLSPDGLHLSATGQEFVATKLINLLQTCGLGSDQLPFDNFPWDQATSGDQYTSVMDEHETCNHRLRVGLGLEMPNFPRVEGSDDGRDANNVFEECGETLTSLQTLNSFFSHKPQVQILGFGSLMSEQSARTTFPNLTNFRIVCVQGYRRVFRHPAAIFFERGIANLETLQISSLSAEKHEGSSFVASVFTIEGETGENFLKREEEFDFHLVPFRGIGENESFSGTGLMCVGGTDENYISRWGHQCYEEKYISRGLCGIWNWSEGSGMLPCSVYLRHCYLSAKRLTHTPEIFESFMRDTYLCDRMTTIGDYLDTHPEVLTTLPPASLAHRYSG
jgi:lysophospholipase L1-like esterase